MYIYEITNNNDTKYVYIILFTSLITADIIAI